MSSPDEILKEAEKAAPLLAEGLRALVTHETTTLDSCLVTVGLPAPLEDTKVTARCHFLLVDGNGRAFEYELARLLVSHVVQFAIPRKRIEEALAQARKGHVAPLAMLHDEAKRLFVESGKTGECGELLLYLLAEVVLRVPQVLCKMSLKTSAKMHVHGADALHATVDDETGILAVYWGESKMYKTAKGAVDECFKSLAPKLLERRDGERDINLLRDTVDLNDERLEAALRRYLDPSSDDYRKTVYKAACLVGFDHANYGFPFTNDSREEVLSEVKRAIVGWQSLIRQAVIQQRLASFSIDVFCVPFASVERMRQEFLKEIGHVTP